MDLISSRWSQYATALLGWTGNKQYNRALREHSKKLGYSLSNTKLVEKKHVRAVIDQLMKRIVKSILNLEPADTRYK